MTNVLFHISGASLVTCAVLDLTPQFHFLACQHVVFLLDLQLGLSPKRRNPRPAQVPRLQRPHSLLLYCNVFINREWAHVSQRSLWVPGRLKNYPLPLLATNMFPVWSYGRVVLILDGRSFLLKIWHWLPTSKRKIRNSQTVPTILQIWLLQL